MLAATPTSAGMNQQRPAIRLIFLIAGFHIIAFLSSCAGIRTETRLPVQVEVLDALKKFERVYLLQPGDQIEVFVYKHPALSRKTVIRPDGAISLPLINDIQASGKTPRELSERLTQLLAQRIRNPEVSVLIENVQEPMVYVLGEVGTPRAVSLRQAKTVAQALAQTGAAPKTASLSTVAIIRLNDKGLMEAHTVKADGYSQPEIYMALNNMLLMPNDLVMVPESYRGQIMRVIQDLNTAFTPYFQIQLLQQVDN